MNGKAGLLSALWLLFLVNYLDRVAVSFAAPSITHSLGLGLDEVGFIISSFSVGYFLAQIPGGLLVDRLGGRIFLIVGPLCWALLTGLTGMATTLASFLLVRFCFGLSEGIPNAAFLAVIGDNFEPRQRARAVAICQTALALAPAIAGPIIGILISSFGWQLMFLCIAGPPVLASLAAYYFIPVRRTPRQDLNVQAEPGSLLRALTHPQMLRVFAAFFGFSIAFWGYLGWMPSYLALAHQIDIKSVGFLASIPYAFAFVGIILGGFLGSGRLYHARPQLAALFYLLAAAFLYVAYAASTVQTSIVGLSGAAFFLFGSLSSISALMLDHAPDQFRGLCASIFNSSGQLGAIIAPTAIGMLVTRTGTFAAGFGLMEVALLAAAGLIISIMFIKNRDATAVTA